MAGCHQFTDLGFQALGKVSLRLEENRDNIYIYIHINFTLIAHKCVSITLILLAQNCKYLERMDLEECNQITDLTLAHLATGCPSLEKLVSFFY